MKKVKHFQTADIAEAFRNRTRGKLVLRNNDCYVIYDTKKYKGFGLDPMKPAWQKDIDDSFKNSKHN